MPVQLSPHFSLAEMTVNGAGLSNIPTGQELTALTNLCKFTLEPIRAHFGRVIVTSGYRCPAVNARAGGVPTSQHLLGEAADIHVPGVDNADIWRWLDDGNAPFDQLIAERLREDNGAAGWIHVSYRFGRLRGDAISIPVAGGHSLPGLHFA